MAKRTVYLKQPIILRLREEDPNGQQPVDMMGQPLRDRDGEPLKPFRVVEHSYPKGAVLMDEEHISHEYVKHHLASPNEGVPDYTVEQLEAMLAEAKARAGADGKPAKGKTTGKASAPWPSDDAILTMKPADLRAALADHGIDSTPFKDEGELLKAVSDAKAKATAKG